MSAPWVVLFVLLWATVLMLVVVTLGLVRRIDAIETQRAAASTQKDLGPPPGLRLSAVIGHEQLTSSTGSSRVFLFMSSTCGMCHRLGDELSSRAEDAASGWLDAANLTIVTDSAGIARAERLSSEIVVQNEGEVSRNWSIPGTPYAVAVDENGIVRSSGFVSRVDALSEIAGSLRTAVPV